LIRFHYHTARVATPRLGIRRGDRLCHVFSDVQDLAGAERELLAWGDGLPFRIQERGTRRQHYDLWGPWLELCGPPADRAAMKAWLRPKQ
jgi:hypothetical protein